MKKKMIKNKCEIEDCNVDMPEALHFHHIIERTMVNTTNHSLNIAILCAVHHELVHSGRLNIIGVYPATRPPNGRILVYELDGKKNVDIDVPHTEFKNISYKLYGEK